APRRIVILGKPNVVGPVAFPIIHAGTHPLLLLLGGVHTAALATDRFRTTGASLLTARGTSRGERSSCPVTSAALAASVGGFTASRRAPSSRAAGTANYSTSS